MAFHLFFLACMADGVNDQISFFHYFHYYYYCIIAPFPPAMGGDLLGFDGSAGSIIHGPEALAPRARSVSVPGGGSWWLVVAWLCGGGQVCFFQGFRHIIALSHLSAIDLERLGHAKIHMWRVVTGRP